MGVNKILRLATTLPAMMLWVVLFGGCGRAATESLSSRPTVRASERASSPPLPTQSEAHLDAHAAAAEVECDAWTLWMSGTQLRGANIYQRRVYPELDGLEFLGAGAVGPPYVQADFDALASLGANYVNVSHPGLFSETQPFQPDPEIQDHLDSLLQMIAEADMFAVISFRTGPGRSEFTFMRDEVGDWFDESYLNESIWLDPLAQDAWVQMWRYTAARYRDNTIVAGYDLMVEPNANEVLGDEWDRDAFYDQHAGRLPDWNQLHPRITHAIRELDAFTPILIGGMGYSALEWMPYIMPTGAPRLVVAFHQYAPFVYTHQWDGDQRFEYPGVFDTNWDGVEDVFDMDWLEAYLRIVDDFTDQHPLPVAVNEFGVTRWAPGASDFIHDELSLFEAKGVNYAIWLWEPSWPPSVEENTAFNFRLGPEPDTTRDTPNQLLEVLQAAWERNTVRPSTLIQGACTESLLK